jgi:hypothetical protein
MLLHEIITIFEREPEKSILIELLVPYKKSLLTYYSRLFSCEPLLMVVSVTNATQYGIIVSANEFSEAIEHHLNGCNTDSEERKGERELISFNSIPLSKL